MIPGPAVAAVVLAVVVLLVLLPLLLPSERSRRPGRHIAERPARRWPSADDIRAGAAAAAGRRLGGNLCVEHLTDPERLAWACPRRYPGRLRRRELVEAIAAHDPHVLVVNPVLLVPRGPQHPDQLKALWRRELLEAAARHASRCEAEPAPPEPDVDPAEVAAVEDALRGENRCQ